MISYFLWLNDPILRLAFLGKNISYKVSIWHFLIVDFTIESPDPSPSTFRWVTFHYRSTYGMLRTSNIRNQRHGRAEFFPSRRWFNFWNSRRDEKSSLTSTDFKTSEMGSDLDWTSDRRVRPSLPNMFIKKFVLKITAELSRLRIE